jgi:hypothetical protein
VRLLSGRGSTFTNRRARAGLSQHSLVDCKGWMGLKNISASVGFEQPDFVENRGNCIK